MKNMVARAWCCVGLMMLGVILGMSMMAFYGNKVLLVIVGILAVSCLIGGVILHYATVRCPHCGSHLGRLYGPRCPFCGRDYNKTE